MSTTEAQDLLEAIDRCADEPIHIPGSIQPHGFLLVVSEPDLRIQQASENVRDWLDVEADLKLVLHPVAEPLASHAKPQSLAFLIGPEGGLSDSEVELASGQGFLPARLGPRVLRTETAPVVALSVAQQLWGDF